MFLMTAATQFATSGSTPEPLDDATVPFGVMKNCVDTVPDRPGFASSCFS